MNGITDLRASYSGLRAFVFGASGFIGRRVVRMLLDCGAQVYPVVRSQTAASQFSSHPSLCDTVACDLRNTAELRDVLTRLRPAIVFNLAAYGVNPAERDAETAYAINAHAPVDICRALCGYSVPEWPGVRLVHAGSALEYGSAAGDLSEVSTAQPATLYGCSKLEGTVQIAREASRTGLRACTARLFMVYGPGERAHRLLPTLITAL